ncbi:hypothetical protein BDC45DRAFT_528011 [Circinella umbellata]|nr:hypothetical protein BDC45DRAFT_528011 [Circinella umbellata]
MNDMDTDAIKFSPSTMLDSFRVEMINFNRQLEGNTGISPENTGSNVVHVDVSASRNGAIHVRRPAANAADANRSTHQSSQHADNNEISCHMLKSYQEAVDKVDPGKTRKRCAAYSERRIHKKVKLVNWPSDIDCKHRAKILGLVRTNNESRRIRYEPITEVQQLEQQLEQEEHQHFEEEEAVEQRLQALMEELKRAKQ